MGCVAVIPARRAERTIVATLESLRLGNAPFVERILVVTSAEDPTAGVVDAWSAHDRAVQLVAAAAPLSAGAARNAGVDAARAGGASPCLFLFVDADCRLEPGGARRLAAGLVEDGAAAVGARVLGEGGLVARIRHALEFKEAASRREPPASWLLPSTVLLCDAAAFDAAGGFPDLWPGEDLVFAQALRDAGRLARRRGDVVAVHRHPPGLRTMLRHQHRLGRTAAVARRTREMPGSSFARSRAKAALLLPARAVRLVAWQAREGPAALAWTLAASPLLGAGLVAWTAGFVSASGAGTADAGTADAGTAGVAHGGARAATAPAEKRPRGEPPAARGVFAGRAGIVVPLHGGERWIGECLESLLATTPASVPIVVVDDASRDGGAACARRVAAANARVRVVALDRNRGFAAAANRGVRELLGAPEAPDAVVLVNQDCVVEGGWLEPLVVALADPAVAVAGARLTDADGFTLQHAGAAIEANGLTRHLGRGCTDAAAWREGRDADYVCGALLAVRADAWRRFGPFDEGYAPAYFEEVDFCVRVRAAGLRVVYVPDSEARHVEASTSGAGTRAFLRRYHRSRMRFVARHLLRRGAALAWLRAEASWLARCGWHDAAPALAAYASLPRLLLEVRR